MNVALIALSISIGALCISHLLLAAQVRRHEHLLAVICFLITPPEVRREIEDQMKENQ